MGRPIGWRAPRISGPPLTWAPSRKWESEDPSRTSANALRILVRYLRYLKCSVVSSHYFGQPLDVIMEKPGRKGEDREAENGMANEEHLQLAPRKANPPTPLGSMWSDRLRAGGWYVPLNYCAPYVGWKLLASSLRWLRIKYFYPAFCGTIRPTPRWLTKKKF